MGTRPARRRLGVPMLLGLIIFVGAPGVFTVPLTGLITTARGGGAAWRLTAGLAGSISVWWLLQSGDIAQQIVRAGVLIGTVALVVLTRRSTMTFGHRALAAVGLAVLGIVVWMAILGYEWRQLQWWIEFRHGFTARQILTVMWAAQSLTARATADVQSLQAFGETLSTVVPIYAQLYGAIVVVWILIGFVAAGLVAEGLGRGAPGTPIGRFIDFRFSEHLGWIAVVGLVIVLFAGDGVLWAVGANALVVAGTLYAVRGAAVALFSLTRRRSPRWLFGILVVLSVIFLLPAVVTWTIVLGVADSGFDLRTRWKKSGRE